LIATLIERVPPVSFLLGLLGCALLSGCGSSGDGYQAVSGSVTYQGERISDGTIQFFSAGEQPVLCGGAMIRDGEYRLPQEHGLKPSNYLVKISATEKLPNPDKDEVAMNPFLARERIPSRFNTESTLTVEVQAGKRALFNFDLQ
jgi:hypothetical protein